MIRDYVRMLRLQQAVRRRFEKEVKQHLKFQHKLEIYDIAFDYIDLKITIKLDMARIIGELRRTKII